MTTPVLLPPPAPAPRTEREAIRPQAPARTSSPATTVVVTLLAALLLAMFNADDLLARARAMPFGWQRTASVDVASALHTVSASVYLNRPRLALDRLFGHERTNGHHDTPVVHMQVQPFRPTAAHPLRIYLGGDSVAQAFTTAFAATVAGHQEISPTVEYRFATGLARPDYFDWPGRLREVLARTDRPQIVVVLFGANDMQPIMTPSGPARVGTDQWLAEYRSRVAATMQLLADAGVDAYWIGQPPMRAPTFDRRINQVDDIYASEAARHPGITFLDTRPLFADAHGSYTATLPGGDGTPVLVRASDGVHLTEAGGRRLTVALLTLIEKRWHLSVR